MIFHHFSGSDEHERPSSHGEAHIPHRNTIQATAGSHQNRQTPTKHLLKLDCRSAANQEPKSTHAAHKSSTHWTTLETSYNEGQDRNLEDLDSGLCTTY